MSILDDGSGDDAALEAAVLDLLRLEPQLYPTRMIDLLRARDATLPFSRLATLLERLLSEGRVARLWHRYLLPRDIDDVRAAWLANITRYCDSVENDARRDVAALGARQHLEGWDG